SSHIDRFISVDDNEHLNIESLIKNLKNVIMKKLFISCIAESLISLSALSISFSVTSLQSLISISVSDSLSSVIPVSVTLTLTTSTLSASAVSAFIISSPCFKKMLCKLNESHLSVKNICVFRNRNADIILFYTHRYETYMS
ncbi:hypothetical protein BDBG_17197, partial [Blastomyces gilchristii SLH14081]